MWLLAIAIHCLFGVAIESTFILLMNLLYHNSKIEDRFEKNTDVVRIVIVIAKAPTISWLK